MEILAPSAKRYIRRYAGSAVPSYLVQHKTLMRVADSKRVLIVDDDPFFRSILKVIISQTGIRIGEYLEAVESQTALAICRERPVDLVFCDLYLPGSDNGIAIISALRGIIPKIPIYMVTAEDTSTVIQDVLKSGATGHILKPVNLRIMRRILASALEAQSGSSEGGMDLAGEAPPGHTTSSGN